MLKWFEGYSSRPQTANGISVLNRRNEHFLYLLTMRMAAYKENAKIIYYAE